MPNEPFVAAIETEQFAASQIEHPPPVEPAIRVLVVSRCENLHDFSAVRIHIGQPSFSCLLIVNAIPRPLFCQRQIVLEMRQQFVAWHDAAGEKVATHPIAGSFVLEFIGQRFVAEDMHEQFSVFSQPA